MSRLGRAQPAPPFRAPVPRIPPGTLTLLDFHAKTGVGSSGESAVYAVVMYGSTVITIKSGLTVDGGNDVSFSDPLITIGLNYHGYTFTLSGDDQVKGGWWRATAT